MTVDGPSRHRLGGLSSTFRAHLDVAWVVGLVVTTLKPALLAS